MTTPNLTWIKTPGRFATGETLKLGSVAVAHWHTPMTSRGEPTKYAVRMSLPGFKHPDLNAVFDTPEAAKARAESAVKTWLNWIAQ